MSESIEKDEKWLLDAEVKYGITERNSRWHVELVFVDTKDPKRILVRNINDFQSKRIAEISAEYMKQTAARDARGTQIVNEDARDINNN